jgi:type IV pilus assembly protein PilV
MKITARHSSARRQQGFTLLEVLIALVILSIGLLGIAALQGVGLRSSQGAYLTSQAGLLAYDMADRIRANPETVASYNGFVGNACPDPVPTTPLLAADLAEWSCSVTTLLPNGEGRITGVENVVPGIGTITTYTITLEWTDLQSEEGDVWDFVLTVDI